MITRILLCLVPFLFLLFPYRFTFLCSRPHDPSSLFCFNSFLPLLDKGGKDSVQTTVIKMVFLTVQHFLYKALRKLFQICEVAGMELTTCWTGRKRCHVLCLVWHMVLDGAKQVVTLTCNIDAPWTAHSLTTVLAFTAGSTPPFTSVCSFFPSSISVFVPGPFFFLSLARIEDSRSGNGGISSRTVA